MIKIEGLDKLAKALDQIGKAIAELDGDIGQVSFDPSDPESINSAITTMEKMIDERVGRYSSNDIIAGLIEETKESFRAAIIEKAASARLGSDNE